MRKNGIVFRISGILCITPAEEILEVVKGPLPQPIPLTKPWLLGIIQFRGEIIPITDLEKFILQDDNKPSFSGTTRSATQSPILVFTRDNYTYGIRISNLIGIEPMPEQNITKHANNIPTELKIMTPTIKGYIEETKKAEKMYIISLSTLTEIETFMNSYQFTTN